MIFFGHIKNYTYLCSEIKNTHIMYNEELQDYFREEDYVPNEIQPEGWDKDGSWIGIKAWREKYGGRMKKRRRKYMKFKKDV